MYNIYSISLLQNRLEHKVGLEAVLLCSCCSSCCSLFVDDVALAAVSPLGAVLVLDVSDDVRLLQDIKND
jgi:hypothetical protein